MTSTSTVTILFTDVVGSTSLRTGRGDTAAQELLQRHNDLVRREVEQHAGQEVKSTGDGFMVAFVSSRRAVECAIAVQRALDARNRASPRDHVQVRIGLNVGEAIREEGDFFGASVDAAARIMAKAMGEQILVSEVLKAVLGAAKDIQLIDRGRFRLKGFPDRWRLHEVVWRTEEAPLPVTPAERTPFVGRLEERETLRRLLEQAQHGRTAIALLGGEAGVGKTRLAQEVVAEARARGVFTNQGRCYEMEGAPPYAPFVEIIEYSLRVAPRETFRTILGDSAPEIARLVPRVRSVFPDLPQPIDLPLDQARHFMFDSICDFIERSTRVQPLLLVLDDLHWADESTILLLDHLAHRLEEARLLVIGTYRDVELQRSSPFAREVDRLSRLSKVHRLNLRRLGRAEVGQIVSGLSGRAPPSPLVDVIFRETEGVPFFVEEVYRHLAEEGRLVDEAGEWRSDVRIGDVEVPESVRMVLGRRLDRVGEAPQRVLTMAAVIGKAFTYEFLRALADEDEDALLDAIDEAERARLIIATESREPYFSFAHEQIRQTLLARISFPRRQRLHLRAAEAIERVYADDLDEHVADLAFHLSQAGARERAAEYLAQAADAAAARFANAEALGYFQRVLELEPAPEQRRKVLKGRARLLLGLFRGPEAASDLEELLQHCRRDGDRVSEVDILLDLGSAYWTVALDKPDFLVKSRAALEEAYALARQLGDKAKMARALLPTIWFTSFWPDYRETLEANIAEAYALSQLAGDEDLVLDARRARLALLSAEEAEAEAAELRRLLEAKRSFVRLNDVLFTLMWTYYNRGKFALCIECCDEGTALARRIGSEPVQYATIKGMALLDLGRFGEAWDSFQQEVADEAHPFGRANRDLGMAAFYAEVMAYERAEQVSRAVIEQARAVGRPWIENWAAAVLGSVLVSTKWLRSTTADGLRSELEAAGAGASREVIAEALIQAGAPGEALTQAESILATSRAGGRILSARRVGRGLREYVPALELKARALVGLGRGEEAVSVLNEGLRLATEMDYGRVLWRLHATLGDAQAALGDSAASARAYAEAASLARALADTIQDAELRAGFLSSPLVAGVTSAANRGSR